jgi:thiol-disulfide isomerase/thioredoxin
MRFLTILIITSIFFAACNRKAGMAQNMENTLLNQEITSHEGYPILVGKIDREGLRGPNYKDWYQEEYDSYSVDAASLDAIKDALKGVAIEVFIGTWCDDSRYVTPHLYKIIDYLGFDEKNMQVVAVDNHPDRRKQSPQHEEAGKNIEYVPTFIFYRNGIELGRIVEYPQESLEKDMATILKNH